MKNSSLLRWAAMFAVALAVKLLADALPDAAVASAFTRPAAWFAALYWNADFDAETVTLFRSGVTLAVVRACSATDFFSIVFALLAFLLPVRGITLRCLVALLAAWAVAVLSNAVRLALLMAIDGHFPAAEIPVVHMAVGMAVFLTVFGLLWYNLQPSGEKKHAK